MTLTCNDPKNKGCHWSGDQTELVCLTDADDDQDFSYCPSCEGDDFESDEDEEEL